MVNEPMEMNTTGASGVPPMVFVDDEGLEEQFLTEDEDTQNVLDTTGNCVTTPVDTIPVNQSGHGRRYCQVATWCKFCTSDTHATQACRRYEKFVKDNPIASSRRNTPVQEQKIAVNTQEPNQRPLFPHPPVQHFNPPVIPQIGTNTLRSQAEEHESREHSQKSPQNQIKEIQTPMSKQLPHQRSYQDVCMDPHYQKPPHYTEIHHH